MKQDPDMVRLAKHRLTYINHRAEKLVETGAMDLAEVGASSYAAGIRMMIFHGMGLLLDLKEDTLRSDLERIIQHCHWLIEDIDETAA